MELIQIGEIRQKTVLDMIHEMVARQFAEIEQLKASAQKRANDRSHRRRVRAAAAR